MGGRGEGRGQGRRVLYTLINKAHSMNGLCYTVWVVVLGRYSIQNCTKSSLGRVGGQQEQHVYVCVGPIRRLLHVALLQMRT